MANPASTKSSSAAGIGIIIVATIATLVALAIITYYGFDTTAGNPLVMMG